MPFPFKKDSENVEESGTKTKADKLKSYMLGKKKPKDKKCPHCGK